MPRAEEIISRIRECMGTHCAEAVLHQTVDSYSEKVQLINRRLDGCISFLRQGLTSEAIHEAEIDPPVLQEAAALDFPERESWRAVCGEILPSVPQIDAQKVIELDEAFPKHAEIAKLLRSHRRLALSRYPLERRIKVLRKLAQSDSGNPIWREDLLTFERARHRELLRAAK